MQSQFLIKNSIMFKLIAFLCVMLLIWCVPRARSAPLVDKYQSIEKQNIAPLTFCQYFDQPSSYKPFEGRKFIDYTFKLSIGKQKTNFFGASNGGCGRLCFSELNLTYKNITEKEKNRKYILPFVRDITFI